MKTPTEEGLRALTASLAAVAFALTFLRLGLRYLKRGRFQADDYGNLVALIFAIIYTGLVLGYLPDLKALKQGVPTIPQLQKITTFNVLGNTFAKLIYVSVQATFLSLYWILFHVSKKFRLAWFAVSGYTALCFLTSFMTTFWNCGNPMDINNQAKCQSSFARTVNVNTLVVVCVCNVTSDLAIFALPIGMLRTLNMKLLQKFCLTCVFAVGGLVIAFDILRTVYSSQTSTSQNINLVMVWNISEPYVAVIVATMPTFYSAFMREKKSSYDYSDLERNSDMKMSGKSTASKEWVSKDLDAGQGRTSALKRDELELKEMQRFAAA